MSEKHLTKGSPQPPFAGKLRFYTNKFCPFAQRVHLVLNAKSIDYEAVYIHLSNRPEWFATKNPRLKVPVLEIKDGVTLPESLIGASYVDEVYPQKPLTAKDPLRRAQDRVVIEDFGRVFNFFFKAVFQKEDTSKDLFVALEELQNEMILRNTKFLHGDTPGYVDYMIWPIFERLATLPIHSDIYKVDETKFSTLLKWISDMKKDPAVMKTYMEPEVHHKCLMDKLNGTNSDDGFL